MFKSDKQSHEDDVSIISAGVEITGNIKTKGNIRIDGAVRGDVSAEGNLTVGASGKVDGSIKAASIIIGGRVNGKVLSKEKLTLEAKAELTGDLFTKILVVEAGAKFIGRSGLNEPAEQQTITHLRLGNAEQ